MYEIQDLLGYNPNFNQLGYSYRRRLEEDNLVQTSKQSNENNSFGNEILSTQSETNTYNNDVPKDTQLTENNQTGIKPQNEPKRKDNDQIIHMTGHGVAGIFTIILFLVPVLILTSCMMDIFVSTKQVDKPLLVGKIDM